MFFSSSISGWPQVSPIILAFSVLRNNMRDSVTHSMHAVTDSSRLMKAFYCLWRNSSTCKVSRKASSGELILTTEQLPRHLCYIQFLVSIYILCQDWLTGFEMRIFTETHEPVSQNYPPKDRISEATFRNTQNDMRLSANTYDSSSLSLLINEIFSNAFQAKLWPFPYPQRMHVQYIYKAVYQLQLASQRSLLDGTNHYLLFYTFRQDSNFWT